MELSSSNDLREHKIQIDTLRRSNEALEATLSSTIERDNLKITDLENKLIQEKLKLDQKNREYIRIGYC